MMSKSDLYLLNVNSMTDSPRLRFRMLPVGGVFSCLGTPAAWEWNGLGLSKELLAGPARGWAGDAVQRFLQLNKTREETMSPLKH